MEGEPDIFILRPKLGVLVRRARMFLLGPVIVLVAGIGLAIATATTGAKPRFAHQMAALGLLLVIYVIAACIVLPQFYRRTGFYAKPGEVGTVGLNGSPRRPAHPV